MLLEIARKIKEKGGTALLVGGCVRDELLGLTPKDFDLEVFGLDPSAIEEIAGNKNQVGKSFGVWKLGDLDISIPRRERKTGSLHTDFDIELDPVMTVKEAGARRDFTFNAIYKDPISGKLHDEWGGVKDLEDRVLRHTSERFSEDPLRVMRAMQFVSRFGVRPTTDTLNVCGNLFEEAKTIPSERLWEEWRKWAKGTHPMLALCFLKACWWIELFPQLSDMIDCQQDPLWHPEGDVFTHTGHVCEAASIIAHRDGLTTEDREVLMFASLLHDVGKPRTTVRSEARRIISPGHAEVGIDIARRFLEGLKAPTNVVNRVCELVRLHMRHCVESITERSARRLLLNGLKYNKPHLLWAVIEADHSGRPPLKGGPPKKMLELKKFVEDLHTGRKAKPLVRGKDLIDRGWTPGPPIGEEVRRLLNLQTEYGFDRQELLDRIGVHTL